LLHEAWQTKKRAAAGVSNPDTERAYAAARDAGALGAKVAGAGGGGFMLVYSAEGRQRDITSALEGEGLAPMHFRFDSSGARVLVNALAA